MSTQDRDEWVDLIANQGTGEMNCRAQTGAEDEAIIELMLDHDYDRCSRCDWWEEQAFTQVIDGEVVCTDYLEESEGEDD